MTTAKVYVGTYAKYASGNIAGAWLNLDDYADRDDFLEACRNLHKDEADPELMFQDFEGFPRSYYSESNIDPALWDWLELDEHDRELLVIYQEHVDQAGTIGEAKDHYIGHGYRDETDWAAEWLEESGQMADIPEWARSYFDFEAYARDARLGGDVIFVRHDGELYVFSGH